MVLGYFFTTLLLFDFHDCDIEAAFRVTSVQRMNMSCGQLEQVVVNILSLPHHECIAHFVID